MKKILLVSGIVVFLTGCCGEPHDADCEGNICTKLVPLEETTEPVEPAAEIPVGTTDERIEISLPQVGQKISSPLHVEGKARGMWFFEASFPVIITNWDGLILAKGFATAKTDWMTEDFVEFEGDIEFDFPEDTPYDRGTVIFQRHNASGLPEHDAAVEIPITFE